MGLLDQVMLQIIQPYFYDSAIFLAVASFCSLLFMRTDLILSKRVRSWICIVPLIIPVIIISFMIVSLLTSFLGGSGIYVASTVTPLGGQNAFNAAYVGGGGLLGAYSFVTITEIMLLIGLISGAATFLAIYLLGARIAVEQLGVIELKDDEQPEVRMIIERVASRLGIEPPRLGLVEDLRPNAFTLIGPKKAIIVLSIGLLDMASDDELEAVIAHEVAHIKNRDGLFHAMSRSLMIVSFYNPFAHLSMHAANREREELADQVALGVIPRASALSGLLQKINDGSWLNCRSRMSTRIGLYFFSISSFSAGTKLMLDHPSIGKRIKNIDNASKGRKVSRRRTNIMVLCSVLILLGGVMACVLSTDLRNDLFEEELLSVHSVDISVEPVSTFASSGQVSTPSAPAPPDNSNQAVTGQSNDTAIDRNKENILSLALHHIT